ncbi:MAG: hypothetical protein KDJ16_18400, partial [Hyphomicrobiales bacterium]|nr:hypothetical protein [Hyphomicrobiales bacterium]
MALECALALAHNRASDPAGGQVKTLLIVDHYLIRTAICDTLRAGSREAQILEAADTTQAARQIETERGLQLVVLDLSLPNGD